MDNEAQLLHPKPSPNPYKTPTPDVDLSLRQRLVLKIRGSVFLGYEKRPGWKDYIAIFFSPLSRLQKTLHRLQAWLQPILSMSLL